jgi:hypothetical protein
VVLQSSVEHTGWVLRRFVEHYAVVLAFVLVTGLCLLSLSLPGLLLVDTPYDVYIPLDAGLRWIDGAWPSRDYPSPIGLFYASLHGLMLSLGHGDVRSVIRADVVVLWLNYLLLWPVMCGLPKLTRATILILLAGTMLTPLALDSISHSYRYVADYNRWSWGFLAVALVWAANPLANTHSARIAMGLAMCCLLYLKLTLFGGAGIIAALGLLREKSWRDFILPAALLLVAVMAGVANDVFLPFLKDNLEISRATDSLRLGKLVVQVASAFNFIPTALAILTGLARGLPARLRLFVIATTIALHLAALQNFDVTVPLIGLPLLLVAGDIGRAGVSWLQPTLVRSPATIQALFLFGVTAAALAWQPHTASAVMAQPVSGPETLGARLTMSTEPGQGPGTGGGDLPYADDVIFQDLQSAQQLLAQLPRGTRVASLEVTNFAVAAWPRLRPATGGLLWYDYHRSYSERSHPAPAQVFAGADAILVPIRFTTKSAQNLVPLYQTWLDRCATVVGSNDFWRLYRPQPVGAEDCRLLPRP